MNGKMSAKKFSLRERAKTLCVDLNRSQKFFAFGTFAAALTALTAVLVEITAFAPFRSFLIFLAVVSIFLLASGIISDLLYVYAKVWATAIGKALLLLVYALTTTTAYALSAQFVNEIVGFDSSVLSNSVAFVAVLLAPLFAFISTYILFVLLFFLGQLYLLFVIYLPSLKGNECLEFLVPKNIENHPGVTLIARMVIYPVVAGLLWGSARFVTPSYENFVKQSAAYFIYQLEAVSYSRCKIPVEDAKIISINEDEAIMVRKVNGEYVFLPIPCDPKISPRNQ